MENQTPYPRPPKSSTVIFETPASWESRRWQTGSSVDHLLKEQRVHMCGRVGWQPGSHSISGCPPSRAVYWHRNDFSSSIPAFVHVHAPWGFFFLLCLCFSLCKAWESVGEKWYPGMKCHCGVTVLAFKSHKHDRIHLGDKILARSRTACALSAPWNNWPSESILMVQATGCDKDGGSRTHNKEKNKGLRELGREFSHAYE